MFSREKIEQTARNILVSANVLQGESERKAAAESSLPNDFTSLIKRAISAEGRDPHGMTNSELASEFVRRCLSPLNMSMVEPVSETVRASVGLSVQVGARVEPITYPSFCSIITVRDFRNHSRATWFPFGDLKTCGEGQMPELSALTNRAEIGVANPYAVDVVIPWQAIVDNRLDGLKDTAWIGRAFSRAKNKAVYAALAENPPMSDGERVFSSAHSNIAASGAAPSISTLTDGYAAMGAQRYPNGEYCNLTPSVLIANPSLKKPVSSALGNSAIVGAYVAAVNQNIPARGETVAIFDSNVFGGAWYLAAHPAQSESICILELEGFELPRVYIEETSPGQPLGLHIRAVSAFGVMFNDFRGLFFNPGA